MYHGSTFVGKKAEKVATEYLITKGFHVIEQNWRQKDCEIDIVAKLINSKVLNFIEVKYRKTIHQGDGLSYITNQKLRRLIYSAKRYMQMHNYGESFEIGILTIKGSNFKVDNFIRHLDF